MAQVMYARNNILFQAVVALASAFIRQENQETVVKEIRKLHELISPQDPKAKADREARMKHMLRREGAKSYKVEAVNLGERE